MNKSGGLPPNSDASKYQSVFGGSDHPEFKVAVRELTQQMVAFTQKNGRIGIPDVQKMVTGKLPKISTSVPQEERLALMLQKVEREKLKGGKSKAERDELEFLRVAISAMLTPGAPTTDQFNAVKPSVRRETSPGEAAPTPAPSSPAATARPSTEASAPAAFEAQPPEAPAPATEVDYSAQVENFATEIRSRLKGLGIDASPATVQSVTMSALKELQRQMPDIELSAVAVYAFHMCTSGTVKRWPLEQVLLEEGLRGVIEAKGWTEATYEDYVSFKPKDVKALNQNSVSVQRQAILKPAPQTAASPTDLLPAFADGLVTLLQTLGPRADPQEVRNLIATQIETLLQQNPEIGFSRSQTTVYIYYACTLPHPKLWPLGHVLLEEGLRGLIEEKEWQAVRCGDFSFVPRDISQLDQNRFLADRKTFLENSTASTATQWSEAERGLIDGFLAFYNSRIRIADLDAEIRREPALSQNAYNLEAMKTLLLQVPGLTVISRDLDQAAIETAKASAQKSLAALKTLPDQSFYNRIKHVEAIYEAVTPSSFPNGSDISAAFKNERKDVEVFAESAVEKLNAAGHSGPAAYLVSSVLSPLFYSCQSEVRQMLSRDYIALVSAFDVTTSSHPGLDFASKEVLFNKLWKGIAQRRAMELLSTLKADAVTDSLFEKLANGEAKQLFETMGTVAEDDLDLKKCMKLFVQFSLYAELSDPPCFLEPAPGTSFKYGSKVAKEILSPGVGHERIKTGDKVEVVFPGLYFQSAEDPSDKECLSSPLVRRLVTT